MFHWTRAVRDQPGRPRLPSRTEDGKRDQILGANFWIEGADFRNFRDMPAQQRETE